MIITSLCDSASFVTKTSSAIVTTIMFAQHSPCSPGVSQGRKREPPRAKHQHHQTMLYQHSPRLHEVKGAVKAHKGEVCPNHWHTLAHHSSTYRWALLGVPAPWLITTVADLVGVEDPQIQHAPVCTCRQLMKRSSSLISSQGKPPANDCALMVDHRVEE